MKLDKKDEKLISYLYHHYREPLTKIAKACRISRDQAEYRLKKYEKEELIKKYLTIFNYNILGYREFIVIWLKLKGKNKEEIKKELESMKNVISVGDVLSQYDLFVNLIFKNKEEFEKMFYTFIEKYKEDVDYYSVFITTSAEFFPLKVFGVFDAEKTYSIVKPSKQIELKEKDLGILKALEKNGRVRVIDIAKQTGLSSEIIVYKLRQYHKNKLIVGTRIQFDMEKLNFYFGVLKIRLKNKTEKVEEKIRTFCKNHKNINALSFGISEYNCLIQIFYQKEKEFRKTIKDINKTLGREMEKSELLLIEKEGRVKTFPH